MRVEGQRHPLGALTGDTDQALRAAQARLPVVGKTGLKRAQFLDRRAFHAGLVATVRIEPMKVRGNRNGRRDWSRFGRFVGNLSFRAARATALIAVQAQIFPIERVGAKLAARVAGKIGVVKDGSAHAKIGST